MKNKLMLALTLTLTTALSVFAEGDTHSGNRSGSIVGYIYDALGNIIGYIYG